ncbi:MAG: carboxypeptidase M32 [Alphaproteobacteria bacterium]|nr:carboxypeptidase M32 [Alphaproteobacteria bacterium]
MTTAYQTLEARAKRVADIGGALAILGWDAQTMMPKGGSEARGEQIATLSAMAHEIETASDLPDLLDAAEAEAEKLDAWQAANLQRMRLAQRRAVAIDPDLVTAMAKATNRAEMTWRDAREKADFALLLPDLDEVFRLTREKASCLAQAFDLAPYDALLDTYETGLRRRAIDPIFQQLAEFLPDFLEKVLASQEKPVPIEGPFPPAKQKALGQRLMSTLGFDFDHGRLDESQHPFCGGLPDDVRITTRYDPNEVTSALMGVLHETGHALYEAGLPKAWRGQPVGASLGMAVHESQSLLIEMQVCRSSAFLSFLSPRLAEAFGEREAFGADNLYRDAIWVERGLIRVDADEVTYPLHIILRYRLEQALLSGDLALSDLPGAWSDGMADLVGIVPEDDAKGCLQDIHWPGGAIGYFPCYTLGAIAAGQLFEALRGVEPGIEDQIARGNFSRLLAWLRENIHERGSTVDMQTLLKDVTGQPLTLEPYLAHLERRY